MEALLFTLLIISIHAALAKPEQQIRDRAGLHFYSETFIIRLSLKVYKIFFSGNPFLKSTTAEIFQEQHKISSPIGAAVVAERNDFYIFRIWQGRKKIHENLFLTFGNPDLINST